MKPPDTVPASRRGFYAVMPRRRKLTAAVFVDVDRRVDPRDARQRMAERDQRERADTRSEVQKFLGDPPRDRGALGNKTIQPTPQSNSARHPRVDLWKRSSVLIYRKTPLPVVRTVQTAQALEPA
jgi:hypothetical protein